MKGGYAASGRVDGAELVSCRRVDPRAPKPPAQVDTSAHQPVSPNPPPRQQSPWRSADGGGTAWTSPARTPPQCWPRPKPQPSSADQTPPSCVAVERHP